MTWHVLRTPTLLLVSLVGVWLLLASATRAGQASPDTLEAPETGASDTTPADEPTDETIGESGEEAAVEEEVVPPSNMELTYAIDNVTLLLAAVLVLFMQATSTVTRGCVRENRPRISGRKRSA